MDSNRGTNNYIRMDASELEEPVYPEVVYLKTHIFIKGVEIGHTEQGLRWLIWHYKKVVKQHVGKSLPLTGPIRTDEDQKYMERMINNLEWHLQLYEEHGTLPTSNGVQ